VLRDAVPEMGYACDHSSEEPAYVLTSDQTHNDYQQYASVFDECGAGATPKALASANPRVRPAGTAARLRFIRQYSTRNVPMSAPIHSAMNNASCDKKYGPRFSAAAPYARMYPSRANDQRKPSAAAHLSLSEMANNHNAGKNKGIHSKTFCCARKTRSNAGFTNDCGSTNMVFPASTGDEEARQEIDSECCQGCQGC